MVFNERFSKLKSLQKVHLCVLFDAKFDNQSIYIMQSFRKKMAISIREYNRKMNRFCTPNENRKDTICQLN